MFNYLRWGHLALFCLTALGCTVNDSFNRTDLTPFSANSGVKREESASFPKPREEQNIDENKTLANEQNITTDADLPEEGPSISPHDLLLDLPTSQDEEEESEAALSPYSSSDKKAYRFFVYDIPIVRNSAVEQWIEYFTGPGRDRFAYWLRQSGRYIDTFRRIFRENNLPEDLAYLPLIESGFTIRARSRAGAVGQWQFMPGTARLRGLKVNRYVDERRHPIKATQAAASYLSFLYQEFGDWHLALAAYNSGENRIRRAMRRTNRTNYWALARTRYLPNETRNYVPKFLAGLIIAKNPEVFGFAEIDYLLPLQYEVVSLPRPMSLRYAAKLAGISLKEISQLNSEFTLPYTPPGKGHLLRLPSGTVARFLERLEHAPKEPYPATGRYQVRAGDTLSSIARRFGVSLQSLKYLNAHLNPKRLKIGTHILLPHIKNKRQHKKVLAKRNDTNPEKSFSHTVSRGENVWMISQRYGVSAEDILSLNGLSETTTIYPGKRLRIRR